MGSLESLAIPQTLASSMGCVKRHTVPRTASTSYEYTGRSAGNQSPSDGMSLPITSHLWLFTLRAGGDRAPSYNTHQKMGEQKTIRFSHLPLPRDIEEGSKWK